MAQLFAVMPPVLPMVTLFLASLMPAYSAVCRIPSSFPLSVGEDVEFMPQSPSAHLTFRQAHPESLGPLQKELNSIIVLNFEGRR